MSIVTTRFHKDCILSTKRIFYILTPSLSRSVWRANGETASEVIEQAGGQSLCENISVLKRGWNEQNLNVTQRHLFSYKVNVNFDMFSALMTNWIMSQVN